MLFTEFDKDVWQNQQKLLSFFSKKFCLGTDEVGRGCLAGPVVAASVIIPNPVIFFVDDSKKLSQKKREMICKEIYSTKPFIGIAFIHPGEIDRVNILNATKFAMIKSINRCLGNVKQKVNKKDILLCIDGNFSLPPIQDIFQHSIIGGDSKVAAISAASVIAKVARDSYMKSMSRIYPKYSFDRNKGYGTIEHMKIIKDCGLTSFHRITFCKGINFGSN